MYTFKLRVYNYGHYTESLKKPCEDAKEKKEVCDSGNEDLSTTGMFCYEAACDKEPGDVREGPGNHFQALSCSVIEHPEFLTSSQGRKQMAGFAQAILTGTTSKREGRGVMTRLR